MTQQTIGWTSQQQAARDTMSTAGPWDGNHLPERTRRHDGPRYPGHTCTTAGLNICQQRM